MFLANCILFILKNDYQRIVSFFFGLTLLIFISIIYSRVVLPLSVEEYQIGQLWSVAEASKQETGGGEGVEVLENRKFNGVDLYGGKYTTGQFTHKIYHVQSYVF